MNIISSSIICSFNKVFCIFYFSVDCCVNRVCWCFTTKGMCCVGQDEIVIILECLPNEIVIPKDIFIHLNTLYREASRGKILLYQKVKS